MWGSAAVATVALTAACLIPATALAAVPSWTTYHRDGARSGVDPDSSAAVPPTQAWQSGALDGAIYGEPLVYGSRVYVATENDTVYALDSGSGAIVWHTHVATAVDAGQLPCGNIAPTVGITSTPVIDPATGRIYVVADTWDGSNPATIAHAMYGLDLSSGSIAVGPVPVDPPGSTHTDQLQRNALALDAGKVIIGYGGNSGDCGSYHGWLVAVPEGGGALQTFEADSRPGDSQGAIWGSGNAPALDAQGNVWISTGNGDESGSGSFDFSESVVKLDSNLTLLDWWAPSDWASLDSSDLDIGSTEPLLLPGGLVFEIGKDGTGYLLDASNLGRTDTGPPVFSQPVCAGSWGGGIYYNGVIYVACADGMYALALDTTNRTFTPLPSWSVDGNAISPPIEAGGLIWSADYNGSNLYGLDPSTGAETFVSGNLNGFEHFATPSAAGGLLFIANQSASSGDQVTAFRIAGTPPPSATSIRLTPSANPAVVGHAVTFTAAVTPAPDGGSIAFTAGGAPIAGCESVAPSFAGVASCTVSFSKSGAHAVTAAYSGDSYYSGSSQSLTETVMPPPPRISHLIVHVVRGKLQIKLTLSRAAMLIIVIDRLVPGRIRHRHCVAGAHHGARCTALKRAAKLKLHSRAGRRRLKPHMRSLARGRYEITITAVAANGQRSTPVPVVVVIRRP